MNTFSTFAISFTLIVLAASVGPGCGQSGEGVAATGASSSSSGQGGSAGAPASSSSGQGGSAAAPASSSSGEAGGAGGQGGAAAGQGGAGGAPASSSSGQGGIGGGGECPPVVVACTTWNVYQCGDGIDNDADGLADANDPQCLGPCDNSEELLSPVVIGSTQACTIDCFFDNDTGSGNDSCYWNHRCDPHEMPPNYYPEGSAGSLCKYDENANTPGTTATCAELRAVQSPTCHAVCDRLTPNGCDCFGCCELPAGSNNYVWLGSTDANALETCTLDAGLDPNKCQPCEPVPACMNSCDTCELCLGKSTVPGGCNSLAQCPQGGTPCGLPGQPCCPSGFYCITGCCRPIQCPPGGTPCGLPGQDPCPSGLYCITGCCQPIPP